MELFAKLVNGEKPLTNFAKNSILDFRQDSGYVSALNMVLLVTFDFSEGVTPRSSLKIVLKNLF